MIVKYINKYCSEDISLIENYELAMADITQMWVCHHRRETHNLETGERLLNDVSKKALIAAGLYYNRPASELIFLRRDEHASWHNKGRIFTEEHRQKISEAKKGKIPTEEHRQKLSKAHKGKPHPCSEEWRRKKFKLIRCLETDQTFESRKAALNWIKQQGLGNSLHKTSTGILTGGGYHWKYVNK